MTIRQVVTYRILNSSPHRQYINVWPVSTDYTSTVQFHNDDNSDTNIKMHPRSRNPVSRLLLYDIIDAKAGILMHNTLNLF